MSSGYEFAPLFLIRMAGVPFDLLDRLATPKITLAARAVLVRQKELARIKTELKQLLAAKPDNLTKEEVHACAKALWSDRSALPTIPALAPLSEGRSRMVEAETALTRALEQELLPAREHLLTTARTVLPRYLVFIDPAVRERLIEQSNRAVAARNKQARAHERHLLLYLQRVCAKNDSLSEFGPEGWGTIVPDAQTLELQPQPGIAARETFVERWVAHGIAAALNSDEEVLAELAPRLNPNGRIDGNKFVFADDGRAVALPEEAMTLLRAVDGNTPAHRMNGTGEILRQLARDKVIRWEAEVPALDAHAFDVLAADVAKWRDTPVRRRWLESLRPIAELPVRFAKNQSIASRFEIMDDARSALSQLGVDRGVSARFLYAASNPIGEECFRDCRFHINEQLVGQVAEQAAPWIRLWQDCYAFIAGRVASGLRGLLKTAPAADGNVSLPAFLQHCASKNVPLTGPGLVAFAHLAFQEVKAAFREQFADRSALVEWEMAAEQAAFVRNTFEFQPFDEFTYPSADLQLAGRSLDDVRQGNYRWILAELHPPVALLHHGFYWSCPDKKALSEALMRTVFGRPHFHFGFFAADFTAATAVHLAEATPGLFNFVSPQRGHPEWPIIAPADAQVYVEDASGDVCLRHRRSGAHLGSFARGWLIPLGFHPFAFSLGPRTPRIRCGNVVVQRRAWTVRSEELGGGDFSGVSRDLVLAIERLRLVNDWPRWIYIRPSEKALRRSGAENRDKDTKPVFIDLESYLFLEIFYRWLTKAGELEITEMLPDPDDLPWIEQDGRRTFEMRTQIVPRR